MRNKFINVNDILYYIKGTQSVESVDSKGGDYLGNVIDMFFNILNLFNNLLHIGSE